MASLQKNGENYGLIWTDSNRTPRQVRESLKTTVHSRAVAKQKKLEWDYHNGEHDPWRQKWYERAESPTMLAMAVELFIGYKVRARGAEGWSDPVARREKSVLRKFVRVVGDMPLSQLEGSDLEEFYYRESVTSDHTRHGDYISINTFLNWCISKEFISDKPQFRPSKPQRKIPKLIYPEDLAELISFRLQIIEGDIKSGRLKQPDHGAYWSVFGWMVLAGTGMRPGELASLKTSHVERDSVMIGEDFDTKVKAQRRVPLLYESRQAVDILTDPKFRRLEPSMRDSVYLLGRDPDYCKKKLSEYFTDTWGRCFPDKPKRTLYNLKDMFAVRYLSGGDGMALNELKEIFGHASIATTEKYLKAVPVGTRVTGTIFTV